MSQEQGAAEPMTAGAIRERIEKEFGEIAERFETVELRTLGAVSGADARADRPGVYVHVRDGLVVRVGRSFSNARVRALQHIPANTGGLMAGLGVDPAAVLLLFTVAQQRDCHWIAALEVFLERDLEPLVPSKRRG